MYVCCLYKLAWLVILAKPLVLLLYNKCSAIVYRAALNLLTHRLFEQQQQVFPE